MTCLSLSPSPSCTWRAHGEWPRSWSCHADHQCHLDSGSSRETSQTKHAHKKVPKDYYRQLRHGKHHIYSTPVSFSFFKPASSHHKEEKKRWSIVAVIVGKSLTSDSPLSSDIPSEESEPDRHQGSSLHAKSSCLFCSIRWRCSSNCQNPQARRRRWTADMHNWSELHQSKTFFSKLKKLKKNICSWCPGKKRKHLCGFQRRISKDCKDPKRWGRTTVGKFLRGLIPSAAPWQCPFNKRRFVLFKKLFCCTWRCFEKDDLLEEDIHKLSCWSYSQRECPWKVCYCIETEKNNDMWRKI